MNKMESIVAELLLEADILLLGLLNNTLFGVSIVQGNRFVFVNQRFAEMVGYTQEALCMGMGPLDLVIADDQPKVQNSINRRLCGEDKSSSYHFRAKHKNNSVFEVEVYGAATQLLRQPAVISILHDISERQAAEQVVEDQLHFIAKLIETIPNPVFYKDEDGRYLGCNAAFERYIGRNRDSLVGRTVYDISPKDLADIYFAADKALFDHPGTQSYETTVSYADGTRHNVVFYKATFDKSDGSLGGLVGVILDISDRKQMEETIWHEANYDGLTGLPNRRLFQDRLNEELKRAQRNDHQLALLFIDLDRFKEVNDTLGHNAGDQLLIQAAQRICVTLRSSDTVARQGGDEFIVILPDITNLSMPERVAQRIINSLTAPFDLDGQPAHVSASIGIACYPNDSMEMETLIRYADQAMYTAKSLGRGCFCPFASAMQAHALLRLEIENDLRHAMFNNQFDVYYQPIIDLTNGRTVKAEALIRWNHSQRGMLNAVEFIPVAEEIGLICEIGDWVFKQAMVAAHRWQSQRLETVSEDAWAQVPIQISVNMSPKQLIAGTRDHWLNHLHQMGMSTQALVVEITEGLLLDERSVVIDTLRSFRDAGVGISIDDFGTGYSAMSYLKKFDIDYLKIDRSFVRDLVAGSRDLAIAETMISMAHKLGIKVIAEGVETVIQYDLLRQAGCDYVQGFLLAKPMPLTDFLHFAAVPYF